MANVQVERSSLDNSFETKMKKEEMKEDTQIKPIVEAKNVVVKKKGLGTKIKESFISEDMKDVGDYIIFDVIVPGIKDAVLSTIERAFGYGGSSRRDRDDRRERTSYGSYYYKSERDNRRRERNRDRDRYDDKVDYRNIILRYKEDADRVADSLNDYIEQYDSVSVATLLDLVNVPGKYVDNNWGWTRRGCIGVQHVRDGWRIAVPEAEYLGD